MLNNKNISLLCLILIIALTSTQTSASLIKNGSFDSCDFNHWTQEVDFASAAANSNEFRQDNQLNGCMAVLRSDYSDTSTEDTVSLSQSFEFSAGINYTLSFEMAALTDAIAIGQSVNDDYFESVNIGLAQNGIFYNETANIGPLIKNWVISENKPIQQFTYNLSADDFLSISNTWNLVFILQRGKINGSVSDESGSSLLIDNISLNSQTPIFVDEPKPLGLFLASLFILVFVQNRKRIKA